jgi:putative addiction module antidote
MQTIKVTSVGDNVQIVLPKSALDHIRMTEGDQLQVHVTKRGVELTPCDNDFQSQIEVAEQIMAEDHEVLRQLAQ